MNSIDPIKLRFIIIQIIGGIAVLGSYIHGIATHKNAGTLLWGGVPLSLRNVYTVNMFLAAAGYFPVAWIWFKYGDVLRIMGRPTHSIIDPIYVLILLPAALWMPLTWVYLDAPSMTSWWAVRSVLLATGLGSILLLLAIWVVREQISSTLFVLAVIGQLAFVLQTSVLDAFVWPALFRST